MDGVDLKSFRLVLLGMNVPVGAWHGSVVKINLCYLQIISDVLLSLYFLRGHLT